MGGKKKPQDSKKTQQHSPPPKEDKDRKNSQEGVPDLSWPEKMIEADRRSKSTSFSDDGSFSPGSINSSLFSSDRSFNSTSQEQRSMSSTPGNTPGKSYERLPVHDVNPHDKLKQLHQRELDASPVKPAPRELTPLESILRTMGVSFNDFCFACLAGLAVILLCIAYLYITAPVPRGLTSVTDDEHRQYMVSNFDKRIAAIVQKFPNQDKRFWKIIKASCKGVLRESLPSQPAVIMLAAHKNHAATVKCLAGHITQAFSSVYKDSRRRATFSTEDYSRFPQSDGLKLHLDSSLRGAFGGGGRAVTVEEVHAVPGKAAAIFHAYCDNENAPFKDAALVFTVHAESDVMSDIDVEDFLTEKWEEDLDIDTLTPLLSRMANNIALVKGEEDTVIAEHC